eukprot:gene10322-7333_t
MKLVEAAAILGISLEDVTTDSLKQQYRRLIMSWDPDTVRDIQAKAKYSQVTEAYKRLSSVMEGKDSVRPEDQHDVAAFMRIFMDMMGMSSEHDIPHAAAMTFSMMFGNHQNGTDEYSTDEDADGNYYDDDEDEEDDEEDYMGEEDLDDECHLEASHETMWEPQAKVYSNMNLKDGVNTMPIEAEAMMKKLKQAKKRAEKRKKQKERRNKEKESGDHGKACGNNEFGDVDVDAASPEVLEKLIAFHQNKARDQMLQCIDDGCSESFEPLIVCRFGESLPAKIMDDVVSGFKLMLPSLNLFHRCWAPIHYAVDRANIPSIRLLAYAGANLQASSATDKRMVPLELAKARIKSSPSNSPSKDQAERVLSLLTEMISWQKTAAKDAEKSKKADTMVDVPSKTPTKAQGKVATPEKKDDKSGSTSTTADPAMASKGSEKKKKKGPESKKKESGASSIVSSKAEPVTSTTPPPAAVEDHSASPSPSPTTTGVTLHSGAIISFASHDEMMDNLLAMGFQESDCLQAIQRYGTDLDSAISWLCERPPEQMVESTKKKEDPPVAPAPVSRGTSGHAAKESATSSSGRGGSNRHSKSQEAKNHDAKNQEPKNHEAKNHESKSHESKQHHESKAQDSKASEAAQTQGTTAAARSKGWNVKEDSKTTKPFSFSQDIGIPTLPPVPPPTRASQQKAAAVPPTPETNKRGSSRKAKGQSQASPAVNRRSAAASDASSAVHPATSRSTPPPVDAEPAVALQAPPLSPPSATVTTTTSSSFLPPFGAGGLDGGLGLGFGSIAQTSSSFMSSGFEKGILGGSMGSFNASFVNALNSIGSASSDHDVDFSLTAGGAIELSAGAKPFVPKTFTPAANPTPIGSGATGIQGASPLPEFSFGATEPSSSLGSSSFGASLPSIDESLRLLSQSSTGGSSLWSSSTVGLGIAGAGGLGSGLRPLGTQSDLPDYLSGILGGGTAGSLDLGLDVNDMMPDLDSLLPTDF